MLNDPRVKFATSAGRGFTGVEHLGLQAEDESELAELYNRLKAADRPLLEEGPTTCCYAKSEKSWISDPQGVVWKAFLTTGKSTVYGGGPALGSVALASACCVPPSASAAASGAARCRSRSGTTRPAARRARRWR